MSMAHARSGVLLLLALSTMAACQRGPTRGFLVEVWAEPGAPVPEYLLFTWARDGVALVTERRIPVAAVDPTVTPLATVRVATDDGEGSRRADVRGMRAEEVVCFAAATNLREPAAGWTTVRLILRAPGAPADKPDAGMPALDAEQPSEDAGTPDAGAQPDVATSAPDAAARDSRPPASPDASPPQDAAFPDSPPAIAREAIVAAGRQGLRLVSVDRGVTWGSPATVSGPAAAEIDGITFGGGQFVAVGERHVYTSPDGVTWQARRHPLGWLQAVAWGNGRYVAVGGNYVSAWSTDAVTWTLGEPVRYGGGDYNVNTIIFNANDGLFYATGVNGGQIAGSNPPRWSYRIYKTPDALRRSPAPDGSNPTWTFVKEVVSGDTGLPSIEVCEGAVKPTIDCGPTPFHGFGVWLRAAHPDQIERSTDGRTFAPVHRAGQGLRAFAFGRL